MDQAGFYVTLNSTTESPTVLSSDIPKAFFENGINYEIGIQRINITTNKKKCCIEILSPQVESLSIIDGLVTPVLRIIDLKQTSWSANYNTIQYHKFSPDDHIVLLVKPSKFDCGSLTVEKTSITLHIRPYF